MQDMQDRRAPLFYFFQKQDSSFLRKIDLGRRGPKSVHPRMRGQKVGSFFGGWQSMSLDGRIA